MHANQGRVIRAIGGFFDVADSNGEIFRCYVRGKHQKQNKYLLVGDMVKFTINEYQQGIIEEILPRDNHFKRPPVANVSQLITVVSACKPSPDWNLLSRQLVFAESIGLRSIICLNKKDLVEEEDLKHLYNKLNTFPYERIITSALTGEGVEGLKQVIQDHVSLFAGASGVGKSSLLNAIQPQLELETAEVSSKIKRGRHTTRRVEIFIINGGMVVDTPGFSKMDLNAEMVEDIDSFFPEIEEYRPSCKFRDCFHKNEPGCAVKEAVDNNNISQMRYDHYLSFLEELEQLRF